MCALKKCDGSDEEWHNDGSLSSAEVLLIHCRTDRPGIPLLRLHHCRARYRCLLLLFVALRTFVCNCLLLLFLLLACAELPCELRKVAIQCHQRRVRALLAEAPGHDRVDVVHLWEEVQRVRDENARLVWRTVEEHVLKYGLADVRVERGEGIVEDLDVCVDVNRAANIDALLLTTRKRDALRWRYQHQRWDRRNIAHPFAHLGEITVRQ